MILQRLLYRTGRLISLSLPLRMAYRVAMSAADIKRIATPRDRRIVSDNLKAALGRQNVGREVKWVFRNFARYLIEFFRYPRMDKAFFERNVEMVGRENLDRALSKRKGVIMLSAHLGNWELGAACLGEFGYDVSAVVMVHKDKFVDEFFTSSRLSKGLKPIPLGGALKGCIRVLKNNGLLGLLGDRNFGPTGVRAEFFGRECMMPRGPAFFHTKFGSPILPCFLLRKKDYGFRFIFEKPIGLENPQGGCGDIKAITSGYLKVLEDYIRRYPEQWFMFTRFWQ